MKSKISIIVIVLAILILSGASIYLLWFRNSDVGKVENNNIPNKVDGKLSTPELIAEQKFAIIELSDEGFSGDSVEVPLGGVLEIRNNTDREVMLDIRSENFVGGLIIKAGETSYSPVFTQAGEYTLSEFADREINEEISAKVSVIK